MIELKNVKSIDLICKKWFDRVNGNTYFSNRIILNYGLPDEKTIFQPLQYGYGSQFEHEANKTLFNNNKSLYANCVEKNIILRYSDSYCLKRDCIANGTINKMILADAFKTAGAREKYALKNYSYILQYTDGGRVLYQFLYSNNAEYQDANGATYDDTMGKWIG